jgi:hypothetical protein
MGDGMDKINSYATIYSYSPDGQRIANRSIGPQNANRSAGSVADKPKEAAPPLPEDQIKQASDASQQKMIEKVSVATTRVELYSPATSLKNKQIDSGFNNLGGTINYKA